MKTRKIEGNVFKLADGTLAVLEDATAAVTERFSAMSLDKEFYPEAKWQVIYKTLSGLDYCRESYNGDYPLEQIKKIAQAEVNLRPMILGGAEIQRF